MDQHASSQVDGILAWSAPTWNSDCSDVKGQLEAFRTFCLHLVRSNSNWTAELECPEQGLMFVALFFAAELQGELYCTLRDGKAEFSLFLESNSRHDADEFYFADIGDGISILQQAV